MTSPKLRSRRKPSSKPKALLKKRKLEQLREEIITDYETRRESSHGLGQKLNVAKKLKPHGGWQKWAKVNLPFSIRKAQSYMRISKAFPDKKTAALFSIRQQDKLAAKSTSHNIREEFIKRAQDGETWTNKDFKEEFDRLSDTQPKTKGSLRAAKSDRSPTEKSTSEPQRVSNAIGKLLDSIEVHLEACPLQNKAKRPKNRARLRKLYLKSKSITAKLKPLKTQSTAPKGKKKKAKKK
jgi:hypothetical protein